MAFHPTTGLVYLPVKDGMFFIHPPDPEWQPGKRAFNAGIEPGYDGPLLEQLLLQPPAQGKLVAWNPVAGRADWTVNFPVAESGGVLATKVAGGRSRTECGE